MKHLHYLVYDNGKLVEDYSTLKVAEKIVKDYNKYYNGKHNVWLETKEEDWPELIEAPKPKVKKHPDSATNLKLDSNKTISVFNKKNNIITVYLKSDSGKPVREPTWKYGDENDIIRAIAKQNNLTVNQLYYNYNPTAIPAEAKVIFNWL